MALTIRLSEDSEKILDNYVANYYFNCGTKNKMIDNIVKDYPKQLAALEEYKQAFFQLSQQHQDLVTALREKQRYQIQIDTILNAG